MDLAASYEAARAVTGHHAKSFYFASIALPPGKKRHAYAVYAFCRHLDDVVDDATGNIDDVLRGLRDFTERVCAGGVTAEEERDLPWLPAFLNTTRECDIPAAFYLDLLKGVEMDRGAVRLQTWEELERYCYHVAGVVGLMMTRVFGLEDRRYEAQAIEMGNAMQLTNILRDVAEDLRMDRIYLPAEELARFGIGEEDLRRGEVTPAWREFMAFQVARAREWYARSERGIAALPNDGSRLTVWLMRDVYAGILEEIEKAGDDVFAGRVHVSLARKCRLGLGAWRKNRSCRLA